MSLGDPVEGMAARLTETAARRDIDAAGRANVVSAFRMAAAVRCERKAPDFLLLHTARTVLILLMDVSVRDAEILTAAALAESDDPDLLISCERVQQEFGERVAELVSGLPQPAVCGDLLLEGLLAAPAPLQLIALAERLDHVRHLHLRPRSDWALMHRTIEEVYLPIAARVDPTLERRLQWWNGSFERRYLKA